MLQRVFVVMIALVLTHHPLHAQRVARFAFDAIGGSGLRSERSGDSWFRSPNREGFVRVSGTLRLGGPGRVRPVLVAAYDVGPMGDEVLICGLAPDGSCFRYFPETGGPSLGVGVDAAITSRLGAAVVAGVAHTDVNLPFVGVRGTVGVLRRVALVAEYRHLAWRDREQRRVWFQPFGVGIRVR
jgi:hypothetical protein